MAARTHDGRPFGVLTIFDGHPRGRLAIKVARSIRSDDCGERLCGVERGLFVVE